MCLSHSGKGKKRAESTEAAAVLLCESDGGIGLAFACCSSLTLRRSSSGSQTDGAALFISETPTATFSSQRRSGGVPGTPRSAVRGILARLVSDTTLSRAWSKDVPNVGKLEGHRENNVFLTFLKGHMVLFLAENNIQEGSNDQKEKRGWEKPALHSLFSSLTEKCRIDCLSGYFVNTRSRTDLAVCSNHSKIQIT